jgi:peroxiredoxin
MTPRKILSIGLLILFAVFSVWITIRAKRLEQGSSGVETSPLVAKPAPDFSLPSFEGHAIRLSDYKGKKVVILSFWASWCGPCRTEMPLLRAFYEKNRHKDFELLTITIDENPEAAKKFATEKALPFPVLLDTQHQVADTYRVKAIPSMFLISKEGTISQFHAGLNPGLEYYLQVQLEHLLGEKK